jgi:hypothetical protein
LQSFGQLVISEQTKKDEERGEEMSNSKILHLFDRLKDFAFI